MHEINIEVHFWNCPKKTISIDFKINLKNTQVMLQKQEWEITY